MAGITYVCGTSTTTTLNIEEYKDVLYKSLNYETAPKIKGNVSGEPYFFVSYTHADYKRVYLDLAYLTLSGYSLWYDVYIQANWHKECEDAIKASDCVGAMFYLGNDVFSDSEHLRHFREELKYCINKWGKNASDHIVVVNIGDPGLIHRVKENLTPEEISVVLGKECAKTYYKCYEDDSDKFSTALIPYMQQILVSGKKKRSFLPVIVGSVTVVVALVVLFLILGKSSSDSDKEKEASTGNLLAETEVTKEASATTNGPEKNVQKTEIKVQVEPDVTVTITKEEAADIVTAAPVATKEPTDTVTTEPVPTEEPKATATTAPTPTEEPKATATTAPTPTEEPKATATTAPTPTEEPKATATPTPTPTEAPTATPTEKPEESPFGELRRGKQLDFGSYEQDSRTSNGSEALEWYVLAVEDDRALLISKYAIDCVPFNSTMSDTSWANSDIRSWLNSSFINTAFSSGEKKYICDTAIGDSSDKVFLLSESEFYSYLSGSEMAKGEATAYTIDRGAYIPSLDDMGLGLLGISSPNYSCWWLRTSGDYGKVRFVGNYGTINTAGAKVNSTDGAVRPAIWVKLK